MMRGILTFVVTWALFSIGGATSSICLGWLSRIRAQRRADRAAWERQERANRRLRRLMRDVWRGPVKPSPIAIRFHALTDDCAVERLLSRLHPVGARPSPESE